MDEHTPPGAASRRTPRRLLRRSVAAAAAVLLAIAAMPAVPAIAREDLTLRIGQVAEDASVSPLRFSGWLSTSLSYDMLVGADPDGNPVPGFAESWSVADDGLTWTIKIRPGMQWSDGKPATASDVKFTIDYVTEATDPVWGAAYFSYWGLKAIDTVTVVDDLTLTIVTKPPKRDWLPVSRIFVLPEHIWKGTPIGDATTTFDPALPSVGTGPYTLTEVKAGQYRRFERNETWWGGEPHVSEILLIPYKSQDALVTALRNGEIDIASNIGVGQAQALANEADIRLLESRQNGFTMLAFNNSGKGGSTAALADRAFRDAIGFALDRDTLVARVYGGYGTPGQSLVSPANAPNFEDITSGVRGFDPAEAGRRLDAAGYRDGDGNGVREDKEGKPLSLRLTIMSSSPEDALVAQFVAGWLGQVGITVTPVALETGAYYEAVYKPDFDLSLYVSGYDANQFVLTQGTTNANNMFFANKAYDAAWQEYTSTFDPAARKALATTMNRIFLEEAPGHVMVYQSQLAAYRTDRLTGWAPEDGTSEFSLMSLSWPIPALTRLNTVEEPEPSDSPVAAPVDPTQAATAAPVATATPATTTAPASDGSPLLPVLAVGVVGLAAIGLVVLVLRRRKA